ncbi:MAG: phospho-sugar mutase [Clostridia bacterium]|nr:phospho-sugar mutase [Clostridia bacterium]
MDYKVAYNNWLSNPKLNAEAIEELTAIKDNEKDIEYRFGADLQFGTAGMRGIIGYGTNMMNVYTVKRATKGLAEYIKTLNFTALERGVIISYDTRKYSDVFAKAAAGVLLANGISVKIFDSPSPVPMLSYAIKHYNAVAGIMITASHNPKEYNGYKVYGEDGAQMSVEATKIVVDFISEVKDIFSIEEKTVSTIKNQGDLYVIGKKFLKKYVKVLTKLTLSKKAVKKYGKKLKIVYTSLHGSGLVPVTEILKKLGINACVVENQKVYDGNFPTVEVPNPENAEALSVGIALADKISADVVLGTDPDCDRLGVAIRNNEGKFVNLTGNQVGVLLTDYILKRLSDLNKLPKNGVVIKSFVSTDLVKPVCDSYGVKLLEVPVGFKYIGEKIKLFEKDKSSEFIFGFEESCGYLRGTHARDKDAVVASMLFAEMVCYYEYNGVSVYSVLEEIYDKYGYVIDKTHSKNYQGLNAMEEMNAVVNKLRYLSFDKFDNYNVLAKRDYLSGVRTMIDGSVEEMDVKGVNCLYYELEIGGFICLRPSGTEPKLKIYYSVKGRDKAMAEKALFKISTAFNEVL